MTDFAYDVQGNLILLANNQTPVPIEGGPTKISPATKSGNPFHDPLSGKFGNSPPGVTVRAGGDLLKNLLNGSKRYIVLRSQSLDAKQISAEPAEKGRVKVTLYDINGKALSSFLVAGQATAPQHAQIQDTQTGRNEQLQHPTSAVPPGIDPDEWARRMDAVRDAAREFDFHQQGDLHEWLKGRTKRDLDPDELDAFARDIRAQRIADLVDVIDHSMRRKIALRARGRRMVRVVPPKGFVQRSINGLEDDELSDIVRRLEARGLDRTLASIDIISRIRSPERRTLLQGQLGVDTDK